MRGTIFKKSYYKIMFFPFMSVQFSHFTSANEGSVYHTEVGPDLCTFGNGARNGVLTPANVKRTRQVVLCSAVVPEAYF